MRKEKVQITKKQAGQFNQMRIALIKIHKNYMTPAQIERNSPKGMGLDYAEALEMAYENIQDVAKRSSKGIKEIKLTP